MKWGRVHTSQRLSITLNLLGRCLQRSQVTSWRKPSAKTYWNIPKKYITIRQLGHGNNPDSQTPCLVLVWHGEKWRRYARCLGHPTPSALPFLQLCYVLWIWVGSMTFLYCECTLVGYNNYTYILLKMRCWIKMVQRRVFYNCMRVDSTAYKVLRLQLTLDLVLFFTCRRFFKIKNDTFQKYS